MNDANKSSDDYNLPPRDRRDAELDNIIDQQSHFSDMDNNKQPRLNQELDELLQNSAQSATYTDASGLKEKSSSKKARLKKAKQGQRKKSQQKAVLLAVCLIAILGLGAFAVMSFLKPKHSETHEAESDTPVAIPERIYYSPLTGHQIANKELQDAAASCVMIENSPAARPQSGLSEAGVVYEAIAEGGITRFMAIFQETKPEIIGPVRSVRMTYAQLAKPYHCSIAHVGGAQNALDLIRGNGEFRDIDQFFNADSYWRENVRPGTNNRISAPHNVYTNATHLDQLNFNKGYTKSEFEGFKRVEADTQFIAAPEEQIAKTVRIRMSSDLYNPVYSYDAANNRYLRSHASAGAHNSIKKDGTLEQNAPNVVIAMKANSVTRDINGYKDYTVVGQNDAFIFQGGSVINASWQRDSVDDELRFVDANGEDIKLNRGQVWISIYPSESGSVSWE